MLLWACLLATAQANASPPNYPWTDGAREGETLANRFEAPTGFVREELETGSFANWLRHLPMKHRWAWVSLHNGLPLPKPGAVAGVVDIDVGDKDLQQCADGIIRLRAEWLYSLGRFDNIRFNFTSGHPARYADWRKGLRPVVNGSKVEWKPNAPPSQGHEDFRNYLDTVFTYAGTASLEKELTPVASVADMRIGDIFIQGGHPGHAMIVAEMASNADGQRVFLLAQGYMPAQSLHLVNHPATGTPWFPAEWAGPLVTPDWTFQPTDLRRFAE